MSHEPEFYKQNTSPDLNARLKDPALPEKIGPYTIESLLSKGGMSLLYLGSSETSKKPVAIKVLPPKFCKNKEVVQRFLKEADVIRKAKHPNLVQLYDQGEWENGFYIAMEFVQGVSLHQFIQNHSLPHKKALEIILQVSLALNHLHSHGIIHRDLKPENILITESGEVKVIDFGIAQTQSKGHEERITRRKRVMGTPLYMSPEQKQNASQVSFPSDIYALGIITYELLLGKLSQGVIHLSKLPKPLNRIVGKALEERVEDRYQTIAEFITDISKAIHLSDLIVEKKTKKSLFDKASDLFLLKKPFSSSQLEMKVKTHRGKEFEALSFDLLHTPSPLFLFFLLEPCKPSLHACLKTLILKGALLQAFSKPPYSLQEVGEHLNQQVLQEESLDLFNLTLLLLNPDENRLSLLSCGSKSVLHLLKEQKQLHRLETTNAPLGQEKNPSLNLVSDQWNPKDLLLLHSAAVSTPLEEKWLEPESFSLEDIFSQCLSTQKHLKDHLFSLITLRRIF